MVGHDVLLVAKEDGHSPHRMLTTYAAWTEGAMEGDVEMSRRAMERSPSRTGPVGLTGKQYPVSGAASAGRRSSISVLPRLAERTGLESGGGACRISKLLICRGRESPPYPSNPAICHQICHWGEVGDLRGEPNWIRRQGPADRQAAAGGSASPRSRRCARQESRR